MNLLEIKDLTIQFNQEGQNINAVQNLNFSLKEGEILGIVGESGSGKSVTAMSITRLLSDHAIYQSGSISFLQNSTTIDLLKCPNAELIKIRGAKISIIFQEPMSSLNPILTCGFQIAEALLAHQMCSKNQVKIKVLYWLEKVGIQDVERAYSSYPHQLSGGQLQRALIAMALCCNPKIVIADEPTTALDVSIQRKILDLLISLKNELGLSIIFISHDLGVIRYLCSRVIVMKSGQKIEENVVEEIFNAPNHPYTKGLIYSRPPLLQKLRKLPTIQDFVIQQTKNWFDNMNIVNPTEQYRINLELSKETAIIKTIDLCVKYSNRTNWLGQSTSELNALNKVNLKVYKGEVVGIVGESGSGKSTLGKAILGLTKISSGETFFYHHKISNLSDQEWRPLRKKLQIVFQDPYTSLNPRKTIASSLIEPMKIHKLYATKEQYRDRAVELLELVGLPSEYLTRYPHQFSGGQRQRICIARALSLQPEFIVCDESVSALDVSIQAQVLNLLMDLKDKLKLSLLFITHDLAVVQFIANRVLIMNKGEILEEGMPYEIIHNPQTEYTKGLINSVIS